MTRFKPLPALLLVALATTLGAASLITQPAIADKGGGSAAPSGPFSSPGVPGPAFWALQGRMEKIATRLEQAAAATGGDVSFANVWLDAQNARITVYRIGETGVAEQARYRQHVPSDIELLFAKALLSREQGDYLFRLVASRLEWLEQNGVVSHLRELGGQGEPFRIYYTGTRPSDSLLKPFLIFGPGTVEFVQGDVSAGFGRHDDWPTPFYGGARIRPPETHVFGTCSTAFGGLSSNGADYMITAYHCVHPGDPRFWTWSNHFMGYAGSHDPKWDVTYIKAPTSPYIYSNAAGESESTTRVVGVAGYDYGAQVCGSGTITLRVCGAMVGPRANWTLTHPVTGVKYTAYGYRVTRGGRYFFADGDSGGPIYTLNSDGTALARGVYSAEPTASVTACPSHVTDNTCYSEALTPDLADIAREQQLDFTR